MDTNAGRINSGIRCLPAARSGDKRDCSQHRGCVCHPDRPVGAPLMGLLTATWDVVCKGLSWCAQRVVNKIPSQT